MATKSPSERKSPAPKVPAHERLTPRAGQPISLDEVGPGAIQALMTTHWTPALAEHWCQQNAMECPASLREFREALADAYEQRSGERVVPPQADDDALVRLHAGRTGGLLPIGPKKGHVTPNRKQQRQQRQQRRQEQPEQEQETVMASEKDDNKDNKKPAPKAGPRPAAKPAPAPVAASAAPPAPKKGAKAPPKPSKKVPVVEPEEQEDQETEATEPANGEAKGGVTNRRRRVLEALAKAPDGLTRGQMAEATGIRKGWSKLLGAVTKGECPPGTMEGDGLVKSTQVEGTRGNTYTLTAKGKKLLNT